MGGRGFNTFFACQYENSYGPTFSSTPESGTVCFNTHDGPSDRERDHNNSPMDK